MLAPVSSDTDRSFYLINIIMYNINFKDTDTPLLEELKQQALSYIEEYLDPQLRQFRYSIMSAFVESCENIITKAKEDFTYLSGNTPDDNLFSYFTKLEEIIPYLLSRTPFVAVNFQENKTWTDNKCIYTENIIRRKYKDTYRYYNNNAYNIKVTKIYNIITKNIYTVSDSYNQCKLYLINDKSVIDGTYIDCCEMPVYRKYIKLPIIVPSIQIITEVAGKQESIFATQHNITALRQLSNEYDVPIKEDKIIMENTINYLNIWYN